MVMVMKARPPRPVLLVDDDRGVLDLLAVLAKRAGLEPHAAADGEQALELLNQGLDPAAVITDLDMPGMGGVELARRIRSEPALAHTRVIVHSGRRVCPPARQLADDWVPKGRPELLTHLLRTL
jgi:CheY-like chemotaxis protein